MRVTVFGVVLAVTVAGCTPPPAPEATIDWSTPRDRQIAALIARRLADWRNGAVVYQVIVDRFAPSENLDAKRPLYAEPRTLHPWNETPRGGRKLEDLGLWSHELAFWGGDLPSLQGKLDYIDALGVDVLYLNPIHAAFTNHKYDAQDFEQVSPEYGRRADVAALAKGCHERGMKLVLDGVFNHMGCTAPRFIDAMSNPDSPWRDWYVISPAYRRGYRGWYNVENLPELNLENPAVRRHLWDDRDSVVQEYLREGVDGWRLDVAYDIGPKYLADLTRAAHSAKPGSWVVGEIWNYPEPWFPAVDGVMNFHLRQIVVDLVDGKITGRLAGVMIDRMIADAGLEPILKSWFQLDNHDTRRLATQIPDPALRRLAMVLQFTLPGSPVVYYGSELGMEGGDDPANRAPMRWDLVEETNETLAFTRRLIALRRESPALRVGEFRLLDTDRLLAFARMTDRAADTRIVVANPTDAPVTEVFATRDGKLMSGNRLRDALAAPDAGEAANVTVFAGRVEVQLPPRSVRIYQPILRDGAVEYNAYKRVR